MDALIRIGYKLDSFWPVLNKSKKSEAEFRTPCGKT